MRKLFFSHRLDLLAEHLSMEIDADDKGIFAPRIIVVPSLSLKQWLLIQLAKESKTKGIAGCKIMTLQEAVQIFLAPSSSTEIYFSLFKALEESQDRDIRSYLDQSPRRFIELANQLTSLFIRYGDFCPSLFQSDPNTANWQKRLFSSLFTTGNLRLSSQITPNPLPSMHCFGFDYLPLAIWQSLNFCWIYLFSPCFHYWEDLCTDRERKSFGRFWKQKGTSIAKREELDAYLKNVPPLLANWGRVGRETLKILDQFELDIEEDYRFQNIECNSTLTRLKGNLLSFSVAKGYEFPEDGSIQLSKTGSSHLREIEHLRASILRLIQEEGLQFWEIAVFAPDIQPYASLIQLVFYDLPIRISGLEIGSKSFFYQGLLHLLDLTEEIRPALEKAKSALRSGVLFNPDDLMALFENRAFNHSKGWGPELMEKMRDWLVFDEEQLLDQFLYLFPEEKKRISTSSADFLEQFLETCRSLRTDLEALNHSRTLSNWSKYLSDLVQKYFSVDFSDEVEMAAWGFFKQTMKELNEVGIDGHLFPFGPVRELLNRSVPEGQIHASHLHAIRFSKLAIGTLLPARAIFLIGMDEENFPRRSISTSLDLLKREKKEPFDSIDQDRYLFLQTLFAAQDYLLISYSHLSPEGNPINPCPFVEELSRSLDAPMRESHPLLPLLNRSAKEIFPWPKKPTRVLPEGEWMISLSDLSSLARHPWEFYCQKKLGIRFEGSDAFSFSRQKAKFSKADLQKENRDSDLPSGICGEALKLEVDAITKEWADRIHAWGLSIEPASFRMSCMKKRKSGDGWEFPSMEFHLDSLRVKLVGEIKAFSLNGYIYAGNDRLDGMLKAWPECLMALMASGRREIYCLKSGKIKRVEKPDEALKAFITYYFFAQSAPSPLLADFADPLLRKGPNEWESKMQDKLLGKSTRYEDLVFDWVVDRISLPPAATWFKEWEEPLRETFSEMIALYPLREKNASL